MVWKSYLSFYKPKSICTPLTLSHYLSIYKIYTHLKFCLIIYYVIKFQFLTCFSDRINTSSYRNFVINNFSIF